MIVHKKYNSKKRQVLLGNKFQLISMSAKNLHLCPPSSFGIVESGVYRCSSAIHPFHFPFIQQLGLKTVIRLNQEVPNRVVTTFFEDLKVETLHVGRNAWNWSSWNAVSEELVKDALESVLDSR